jgi:hypothetical protein
LPTKSGVQKSFGVHVTWKKSVIEPTRGRKYCHR